MLEQINSPQDLKKLNEKEKKQLAEEIRKYILDVVSENGGHLASNLGVVELTIALHSVFNVPEDKIVWDVGHQSYVHKIITGRREELKNIRKLNGIAGFPKSNESDADCFNTGHSSTSISAVLGMARARDLQGKKNSCIAVIGDGALTGGMALEALNDAGCSNCNLTVILNDNEMSIAKNIGGINQFLSTLRTKKLYTRTNKLIKNKLNKLPFVGNKLVRIIQRFKRACKQLVIRGMYFEDIGFTYLGPVDGHNIEKLESISRVYFSRLKNTELYDMTLNYTKEYDEEFYNILVNNKEYALSVLNIERDIERPRKDIASLSDVKKEFWYMFNELFNKNNEEYADVKKCDKETVINYLNNVYNDTDTQEEWFNKVKEYACNNGYTADKKAYKAEPEKYIGMVADFCALLRVIICKKNQSPNIYYLIKYLGREELINRTNKFFN